MFEFWRFAAIDTSQYIEISGEFDYVLVFLSLCVAALASYSTLTVLERLWATTNASGYKAWLWFGSVVMGLGVWAMHFTGMMAFMIPVPMAYDPVITAVSALPPILGAYFALKILFYRLFSFWHIQLGALSLAVGIGTMHFVGMEAMIMDVEMRYDLLLFVASIIIAHILASIALYVRVLVKTDEYSPIYIRILSAIVMGCAVAAMHYTAMASVTFYTIDQVAADHPHMPVNVLVLGLILVAVTAIFVVITVIGALIDRKLELAEVRQKSIVNGLADSLIVIDEKGKIETFNASGAVMFEQSEIDIIGKDIQALIPGISADQLVADCDNNTPEIIGKTVQLEGLRSNLQRFPIEVTFSRIDMNSRMMFSAVIRDITARKELEHQLRQAQKLESIGQLAAGIAHEINTPTQYISDNTHFLKNSFQEMQQMITACRKVFEEQGAQDLRPDQVDSLKKLLASSDIDFVMQEIPPSIDQSLEGLKRVSNIIGAMKYFSHKSGEQKEMTNLEEAIEATVTVARNEWKYVAAIEYSYEPNLPLVPCLRDEFNQVILNLVVNSAHAIGERLKNESDLVGKIIISIKKSTDKVIVSVEDNGSGMPEKVKEKIFDPFFTTKEVGKGTGQGLSMAYSIIVEGHGGDIQVFTTEGEGTCFQISLPLKEKGGLHKVDEAV